MDEWQWSSLVLTLSTKLWTYQSMTTEEEFKARMTSSENQIAFAASTTPFFLRTSDGPSAFHNYLKESATSVAGFMPEWSSKRKIKTYAIFGAVVLLLKRKVEETGDIETEDLFQHLFGDVDIFDQLIFKEILATVDAVEKKLEQNTKKPK